MTYSVEVRREAFSLLARGRSVKEVAAELGVSGSTVRLWRIEVGGVLHEHTTTTSWHLSRDERYELSRLHEAGHSIRAIAARLGRAPSTISRELLRPQRPVGAPGRPAGRAAGRRYQPEAAHQAAVTARLRPRPSLFTLRPQLKAQTQTWLDQRFSPEQISGRLRVEFAEDEQMQISHETIYRAIYVRPRGELRGEMRRELQAHLRTGRNRRRRRNTRQHRDNADRARGGIIDPTPITQRPDDVAGRLVPGHYEGDLMLGPVGTRAALGTLVERTSGHLTVFHLPHDHTSAATTAALIHAVTRTGWPMRTLTWDRGTEMAGHATFTLATDIAVYFADPHAPWQRGSNENTNGLLREYFPKGLDLATLTNDQIQAAVDQLNNRPRKRLGYRTPNEILANLITQDQQTTGVAVTP